MDLLAGTRVTPRRQTAVVTSRAQRVGTERWVAERPARPRTREIHEGQLTATTGAMTLPGARSDLACCGVASNEHGMRASWCSAGLTVGSVILGV
jgi:hypothetical protein